MQSFLRDAIKGAALKSSNADVKGVQSVSMIRLLAIAACSAAVLAAQSEYVGAARCGTCHPEKFARQQSSEHAHALSRPAAHALASDFAPDKTFIRSGKYSFQFLRTGTTLQVRAFDATRQLETPLEWAFGAGAQAVTFVSRADSDWYLEHAFSYYPAARSYATTPGQPAPAEDSLPAALGRLFRSTGPNPDVRNCFECHSTGPVSIDRSGQLEPSEPGVNCEVCHGPGGRHAIAKTRASIQNPARMTPPELNTFCGTCHRQPAVADEETDWNVSWNVRHQPIYLNQAACFRKSDNALSCLTCHDPHDALRTDDAFYNAKCAACHDRSTHIATASPNCVGCHMPRVSPQPWLRFTNHWIGVYGEGNKLKPRPSKPRMSKPRLSKP
jgi:hypothetical protein